MTADELIATFDARNHCCVYHACTVTTFLSYCRLEAYVSRRALATSGLPMTAQVSDETDRHLGIFNHLFLNVFDQHGDHIGPRSVFGLNKYGAVLMVIDAEALRLLGNDIRSYRLEITEPSYDPAQHEITDIQDFIDDTFKYTVAHAYTDDPSRRPGTRGPASCLFAPDPGGGIPFKPYLREIVLDRLPEQHAHLEAKAKDDLTTALDAAGVDINVRMRNCVPQCGCRPAYRAMSTSQVERFFYSDTMEVYSMQLPRYSANE